MTIEIVREPLTYEPGSPHSYFRDLARGHQGDNAANARLARHAGEIKVEVAARDKRALAAVPGDIEFRSNPDRDAGKGGSFAPPLWLIDQFAAAPRTGRVLADMIPGFTLPQGVQSVSVPRLTTGNKAAPVADNAATPGADIVDAAVNSPVVTIAGQGTVPVQALDQSPPGAHLDHAFFRDLAESYDEQLEMQLINGTGANTTTGPQLTGLLQAGGNAIAYTDASPTASEMYGPFGQAVAAIGNNRKMPPEVWLTRTSRWAWLTSGEDTTGRPLALANHEGPLPLVGYILAFPAALNDAVPATLAGGNQDVVIACRPSDMLLLESSPRATIDIESLSGTLQVRLGLHAYVAALVGRYPTGISVVGGTGTVVQSGF